MDSPLFFRSVVPLVLGLAVGGLGASLFLDSLPAPEGSPEERARKLELELERTQKRLAAMEAAQGRSDSSGTPLTRVTKTVADSARNLGEDLRAGRPVNPEDIFRSSKGLIKDLAPFFDRIRVKQQAAMIDGITGELARKYNLSPEKESALKEWFEKRAGEEAKRWTDLLAADHTSLDDVAKASREVRPDEGLEGFMEGLLPPEQYAEFKAARLEERAERVQREADTKVQRLDSIVNLDEAQRDQIFTIVARKSRDYDSSMVLETAGSSVGGAGDSGQITDIQSVLRPEQRAAYEAERKRRYEEASKGAAEIGLSLPPDWELMDDDF